MCFINDQLLGNAFDLKKWAQKVWDVVDVRPSALYEALTLDYSTKFLKDTKASYTGFLIELSIWVNSALIVDVLTKEIHQEIKT